MLLEWGGAAMKVGEAERCSIQVVDRVAAMGKQKQAPVQLFKSYGGKMHLAQLDRPVTSLLGLQGGKFFIEHRHLSSTISMASTQLLVPRSGKPLHLAVFPISPYNLS